MEGSLFIFVPATNSLWTPFYLLSFYLLGPHILLCLFRWMGEEKRKGGKREKALSSSWAWRFNIQDWAEAEVRQGWSIRLAQGSLQKELWTRNPTYSRWDEVWAEMGRPELVLKGTEAETQKEIAELEVRWRLGRAWKGLCSLSLVLAHPTFPTSLFCAKKKWPSLLFVFFCHTTTTLTTFLTAEVCSPHTKQLSATPAQCPTVQPSSDPSRS